MRAVLAPSPVVTSQVLGIYRLARRFVSECGMPPEFPEIGNDVQEVVRRPNSLDLAARNDARNVINYKDSVNIGLPLREQVEKWTEAREGEGRGPIEAPLQGFIGWKTPSSKNSSSDCN